MKQGVLFARVDRHVVFAGHGRIDELQKHLVADALDIPVAPDFKREGTRGAAAVLDRPVVSPPEGWDSTSSGLP